MTRRWRTSSRRRRKTRKRSRIRGRNRRQRESYGGEVLPFILLGEHASLDELQTERSLLVASLRENLDN